MASRLAELCGLPARVRCRWAWAAAVRVRLGGCCCGGVLAGGGSYPCAPPPLLPPRRGPAPRVHGAAVLAAEGRAPRMAVLIHVLNLIN